MLTWLEIDEAGRVVRRFGDGTVEVFGGLGVSASAVGDEDDNFRVVSRPRTSSTDTDSADKGKKSMFEIWRAWQAKFIGDGHDEAKAARMASRACGYTPSMEDLADELRAMPESQKEAWRSEYRRFRYTEGKDEAAAKRMANVSCGFDGSALAAL